MSDLRGCMWVWGCINCEGLPSQVAGPSIFDMYPISPLHGPHSLIHPPRSNPTHKTGSINKPQAQPHLLALTGRAGLQGALLG